MTEQTIKFNEKEGLDGFLIGGDTRLLHIFPSRTHQKITDSSKVKLTNIVDYSWDAQFGIGRLTAAHYSGKYIAYCVKVGGAGAVRVVDLDTKDRVLMRGNRGLIRDVEFMHKVDELVLGFIDEYGSFYIYRIVCNVKLETVLLLNVELEGPPRRLEFRRFIWCRYVPEEGDGAEAETPSRDPPSYQFAIIEDDVVYVANLLGIISKHEAGVHSFPTLQGTYLTIREHAEAVVDASFAPDGTAIATASKDGTVKFFQIYFLSESGGEPRCLYSWSPHNGDPVTKIFFLDDHTITSNDSESQYWKFVITAGPNMNELKLWNCMKWECVQTLLFSCPNPSSLRMDMNITANFFVLADSQRKAMYVINVEHDEHGAAFKWITEFSVPVPVLGFNVCNAELCSMRKIIERGFEHFFSENDTSDAVVVDIIFIQPKSLMEASMAFRPPIQRISPLNGRSHSRISFDDSVSFKDEEEKDYNAEEEELPEPPQKTRRSPSPRNTPTKIPSPRSQGSAKSRELSPRRRSVSPSALRKSSASAASVTHLTKQLSSLIGLGFGGSPGCTEQLNPFMASMTAEQISATVPIRVRTTSSTNGNLSNASSSPSREVEEILSPKNSEGGEVSQKTEMTVYQTLDVGFGGHALDIEGNFVESHDLKILSPKPHQLPTKAKSLGGVDTLTQMGPQLPQVLDQVNSIMDMMKAQAEEMKELKAEVSRLNRAQQSGGNRQLDESTLARCLDKYTGMNEASLKRTEESLKSIIFTLAKENRGIPKGFAQNVTLDLAHAIKTEIESTVLPQLLKVFEPVCLHLNSELDGLVRGAENKVKHQIGQMLNSEEFRTMFHSQVEDAVKGVSDRALRDALVSTVCPNFEKSLQSLYLTINDTFMNGTKEYLRGLESSVTLSRTSNEDLQDSLKRQFMTMQDTLSSILQVEVESQLRAVTSTLQRDLLSELKVAVSNEIQKAFQEQQIFFEVAVTPRRGGGNPTN